MAILNKDYLTFNGTYVETIDDVEVTRNYSIDINPNIISHITTNLEENILGSLSINPKNFVFNFSNSLCNFDINPASLSITTPSLAFAANPGGLSVSSSSVSFAVNPGGLNLSSVSTDPLTNVTTTITHQVNAGGILYKDQTTSDGTTTTPLTFNVNPGGISYDNILSSSTRVKFEVNPSYLSYTGPANLKFVVCEPNSNLGLAFYDQGLNSTLQAPTIPVFAVGSSIGLLVNNPALSPTSSMDKPLFIVNPSGITSYQPHVQNKPAFIYNSSKFNYIFGYGTGFEHSTTGFDVTVGNYDHLNFTQSAELCIWREGNSYDAANTQYKAMLSASTGIFRIQGVGSDYTDKHFEVLPSNGNINFSGNGGSFIVGTASEGLKLQYQDYQHTNNPLVLFEVNNSFTWKNKLYSNTYRDVLFDFSPSGLNIANFTKSSLDLTPTEFNVVVDHDVTTDSQTGDKITTNTQELIISNIQNAGTATETAAILNYYDSTADLTITEGTLTFTSKTNNHTLEFTDLGELLIDNVPISGGSSEIIGPTVNNKYNKLTTNSNGDIVIETHEIINNVDTVINILVYDLTGNLTVPTLTTKEIIIPETTNTFVVGDSYDTPDSDVTLDAYSGIFSIFEKTTNDDITLNELSFKYISSNDDGYIVTIYADDDINNINDISSDSSTKEAHTSYKVYDTEYTNVSNTDNNFVEITLSNMNTLIDKTYFAIMIETDGACIGAEFNNPFIPYSDDNIELQDEGNTLLLSMTYEVN